MGFPDDDTDLSDETVENFLAHPIVDEARDKLRRREFSGKRRFVVKIAIAQLIQDLRRHLARVDLPVSR